MTTARGSFWVFAALLMSLSLLVSFPLLAQPKAGTGGAKNPLVTIDIDSVDDAPALICVMFKGKAAPGNVLFPHLVDQGVLVEDTSSARPYHRYVGTHGLSDELAKCEGSKLLNFGGETITNTSDPQCIERAMRQEACKSCGPAIDVPNDPNDKEAPLYVRCTHNPLGTTDKVAVLLLQFERTDNVRNPTQTANYNFQIAQLSAQPGALSVEVPNLEEKDTRVVVSVLGGSYRALDHPFVGDARHVSIALEPRCVARTLSVAGSFEDALVATESLSTQPDYHCTFPVEGGLIRAELPLDAGAEEKILTSAIDLPAHVEKGPTPTATTFETRWNTRVPPYDLTTLATRFRLTWERDCMYPSDYACPTLLLVESGLRCDALKSPDPPACIYECSVKAGLALPARVRFSALQKSGTGASSSVSDMSWDDAVAGANARLDSYVPAEGRVLPIDWSEFDGWPTSEIESIDLLGTSGATHHLKTPSDDPKALPRNTTIRLPLGCNDSMVYQVHGIRSYWDGVATVEKGRLHPNKPAPVPWHVGAAILGGVDVRFASSNPNDPDTRELIVGEVEVGFRPEGVRHVLELRGGYAFTRTQFFDNSGDKHNVPYNRYHVYAGWSYHPNPAVSIGTGAGVVIGHALDTADWVQAGGLRVMPWFGLIDFTIFPWRFLDIGFQVSPRVGIEPLVRFSDPQNATGSVTWDPTFQLSFGVRFNRD